MLSALNVKDRSVLPKGVLRGLSSVGTAIEKSIALPALSDLENWDCEAMVLTDTADTLLQVLDSMMMMLDTFIQDIEMQVRPVHRDVRQAVESLLCLYQNRSEYLIHNRLHTLGHCFMSTQAAFAMLTSCGGARILGPMVSFTILLATIGHDVLHPGLTNNYLLETRDEVCERYPSATPLEEMQVACTMGCIEKYRLFYRLSAEDRNAIGDLIRECILATVSGKPTALLEQCKSIRKINTKSTFREKSPLCRLIVHCTDMTSYTKSWDMCKNWSAKLMNERFEQGELEKSKGINVSPNCNPFTVDIPNLQVKFLRYSVLPAFQLLEKFLPKIHIATLNAEDNLLRWKSCARKSLTVDQRSLIREISSTYRGKRTLVSNAIPYKFKLPRTKNPKLGVLFKRLKQNSAIIVNTLLWKILTTVLTLGALYADDIRTAGCSKSWDAIFETFAIYTFLIFCCEIVFNCLANPKFLGSFYFYMDCCSTFTMLFDVPMLWPERWNYSNYVFNSASLFRISRTIKVFNYIRSSRIFRKLEGKKESSKGGKSAIHPQTDSQAHAFFPEQEINGLFDRLDKRGSGKLGLSEVELMMNIAYNGAKIPDTAINNMYSALLPRHPENSTIITRESFTTGILTAKTKTSAPSQNRKSLLGKKLSELATRRLLVIVQGILLITSICSNLAYDYNQSQDYGLYQLHGYVRGEWKVRSSLQSEVAYFVTKTSPLHAKLSPPQNKLHIEGLKFKYSAEAWKTYRPTELEVVTIQGCKHPFKVSATTDIVSNNKEGLSNCTSVAYYDRLDFTTSESCYNLFRTTASIICLFIGTILFKWDTRRLVVAPVERMVEVVEQLARNPLAKLPVRTSLKRKENEIQLLEDTFIKVANLVQIGFGEAGAEIIACNMPAGDLNPMMPGKKIHAVFGFCDIRRFTDATECLCENVMEFTNIIGHIVHSAVNKFDGAPNKNIGDAFLLVWKIPETSSEVSVMDSCSEVTNASRTMSLFDFEDVTDRRIGTMMLESKTVSRYSMADKALMSFLQIHLELSHSIELVKYRNHPSLMKRFSPPFAVKMGYGLHAGWAIEGSIGSSYKIDASYISCDVGVSQKLEEHTKNYGLPLLFSHKFYSLLSSRAQHLCRAVDTIQLNDSIDKMTVYTFDVNFTKLVEINSLDDLSDLQVNLNDFRILCRQAFQYYNSKNWSQAERFLNLALGLQPGDGPCLRLLQNIQSYKAEL